MGLNILTGYAGQLSLGTAAFMAVGAFAAYNFVLRVPGMPILVAFVLAGVCAALVGIVFGLAEPADQRFLSRGGDTRRPVLRGVGADQVQLVFELQHVRRHQRAEDGNLGFSFDSPVSKYLLTLSVVAVLGSREEHGAELGRPGVDGRARHGRARRR
jgi:branched-chain amino acid transport system permease protein